MPTGWLTIAAAIAAMALPAVCGAALTPAQDRTQVADCEHGPVIVGSGQADWRRESVAAGPLGVARHPLSQMSATGDGQLVAKMPVLVEGHREVRLSVPPREQDRVFLYFGWFENAAGQKTTTMTGAPGFSEVSFQPCADRPRTIWPGGIRIRGRRPVHLVVTVAAPPRAYPRALTLPLGRPRVYRGP
jgi:hypothetical protein